ncbi:hypothetical protein CTheo_943 [Ceratobasidium theobromae]|uniref:Transmembrane protein n=1 Tax=Ceratobasidium theobromae TaxID=1582974 RepID=A0A5N5QVB3_9AGAM|nr:hypothetical protein CTheo_943 [Ceratobasidium theobromae]
MALSPCAELFPERPYDAHGQTTTTTDPTATTTLVHSRLSPVLWSATLAPAPTSPRGALCLVCRPQIQYFSPGRRSRQTPPPSALPTSLSRRGLAGKSVGLYLRVGRQLTSPRYFHDWVLHYRQLYKEWAESVLPTTNIPSSSKGLYRSRDLWERLKDCQDRQLREEFAFAKATFFENGASMRLNIHHSLRDSVLLIPNGPPPQGIHQDLTDKLPSFPNQPEPSIFDAILNHVDRALEAAFARFLRLAFCNSGLWHSCIGNFVGICILASGLTLWSIGISSRRRRYVAGSLPLIWVGVWFMLVSANGHCLGVYVTGDARQLYPHEFARPLPPDTSPPPVYSLALPPNDATTDSSYQHSRKPSTASHLLPLVSTPPLPPPQPSHQPRAHLSSGRRASEGVLRLLTRRGEDKAETRSLDRAVDIEPRLPPARKTKNLPRSSLAMDVEQATGLGPALLPLSITSDRKTMMERRGTIVDLDVAQGRPDSPFSEENDFGIVVSEAYEEDAPEPFLYPDGQSPTTAVGSSSSAAGDESKAHSPSLLEPLAPLVQVPEYAAQRRRTMPDLFMPGIPALMPSLAVIDVESRRGSKSSDGDRDGTGDVRWPWPRKLFGPMTLVHSPIVRRAHWAMTIRTAIIASIVTSGMTLGLVR